MSKKIKFLATIMFPVAILLFLFFADATNISATTISNQAKQSISTAPSDNGDFFNSSLGNDNITVIEENPLFPSFIRKFIFSPIGIITLLIILFAIFVHLKKTEADKRISCEMRRTKETEKEYHDKGKNLEDISKKQLNQTLADKTSIKQIFKREIEDLEKEIRDIKKYEKSKLT